MKMVSSLLVFYRLQHRTKHTILLCLIKATDFCQLQFQSRKRKINGNINGDSRAHMPRRIHREAAWERVLTCHPKHLVDVIVL